MAPPRSAGSGVGCRFYDMVIEMIVGTQENTVVDLESELTQATINVSTAGRSDSRCLIDS